MYGARTLFPRDLCPFVQYLRHSRKWHSRIVHGHILFSFVSLGIESQIAYRT